MEKIKVVVNGLSGTKGFGKMALEVAKAIVGSDDMVLIPFGLAGPKEIKRSIKIGNVSVKFFKASSRGKTWFLKQLKSYGKPDIVVDFTEPGAVKSNVDFYTTNRLPFVMGTTGGDLEYIKNKVAETQQLGGIYNVVVAPNMAAEIVMIQAMFEYAAENFSGALKRFSAKIVESHQTGKRDTSGTAKALVECLKALGINCSVKEICKIRTEKGHKAFGVPPEFWGGHGWHKYVLTRDDGNVSLQFRHNVNGRQPYADGTLQAIRFLHEVQNNLSDFGRVFSMTDVLKNLS